MMANWYLGTMGFSYQDWVGVFYPQAMKVRGFLGHYSRFFNAVEVDSTKGTLVLQRRKLVQLLGSDLPVPVRVALSHGSDSCCGGIDRWGTYSRRTASAAAGQHGNVQYEYPAIGTCGVRAWNGHRTEDTNGLQSKEIILLATH